MCLMLESPWDMGTFCKSVLSQLVSEHNFPALSRNGIAAGEKKKKKRGFKFYKDTHTHTLTHGAGV